jgi:hypothetical protein
MAYKHIAINEAYNSKVEELALSFSKDNKGKLIEIMVDYFKTTGIDPRDLEGTILKKEFKKLEDTIAEFKDTTVSFIRQQEKDFLKPINDQVNANTQQLLIYLSQEPLSVKHLERFESLLSSGGSHTKEKTKFQDTQQPADVTKDHKAEIENIRTKIEMFITEAKNIFSQFIKTGKKSVGRGIFFEQAVIDMYEGHFERLKLKI